MKRNIKITIEYDGTAFHGWQTQPSGQRTVQSTIQEAARKILGENVQLIGSGRTDSGVHALGQVANFKTNSSIPCVQLVNALNAHMPEDIAILDAREVPLNFHAQFHAKSKTYRYLILNRKQPSARQRHFVLHYPYKLNISRMRKEAAALLGKKDFLSFQSTDAKSKLAKKRKGSIRTVKKAVLKKQRDLIIFEIEADGFLYKMVRNIVGALLTCGSGAKGALSINELLAARSRPQRVKTAEARGLTLVEVKY